MDDQFDLEYSFRSTHIHCGSTAGSFSAPSTTGSLHESFTPSTTGSLHDPFTPSSGRSTPGFLTMPTDHDNVACGTLGMGPTPPPSTYGPFLTQDMKPEASHYMGLGHNTYNHEMVTPPMGYQPAAYVPENYNFNTLPPWSWPSEDGPVTFFEGGQPGMFGEAYPTPPYQAVQERATALHRVQCQTRASKRNRMPMVMVASRTQPVSNRIKAALCTSGLFACPHKHCRDKKPFKRQEHLKRHQNTVHKDEEEVDCPFCPRTFNRTDNFGAHIRLHIDDGKPGRTKKHPDAEAFYAVLQSKKKPRRRAQRKAASAKPKN